MAADENAILDPRIARTRRDVTDATGALLLEGGWDAVTHAAVASRSGYAKATIYTHWPTRLDLIRDAIEHLCDRPSSHPPTTGDLRVDLRASLLDFADDLTIGRLDRLLGGVVERAATSDVVDRLRARLYETGTAPLRAILAAHLDPADVAPTLALLTGAVFARATFEGADVTPGVVEDLVERVLAGTLPPRRR